MKFFCNSGALKFLFCYANNECIKCYQLHNSIGGQILSDFYTLSCTHISFQPLAVWFKNNSSYKIKDKKNCYPEIR